MPEARPRFLLGSEDGEHLLVEPMRREHPEAADYWDANWICTDVRLRAGAFRGKYEAILRAEEFVAFRAALAPLVTNLSGSAAFHTMEHWLAIRIVGNGQGRFIASCDVRDAAGVGNRLSFTLEFDQTILPTMLADLDEAIAHFPVTGSPHK
jgi:hypothetical protein